MVPTIGRRMWAFMTPRTMEMVGLKSWNPELPFDAGVVYVNASGNTITAVITDHTGETIAMQSVPVRAPGDVIDRGQLLQNRAYYEVWVEWMPYQQQQAAKALSGT